MGSTHCEALSYGIFSARATESSLNTILIPLRVTTQTYVGNLQKEKVPYLIPQLEDFIQTGAISVYHNGICVSINHFKVHLNKKKIALKNKEEPLHLLQVSHNFQGSKITP